MAATRAGSWLVGCDRSKESFSLNRLGKEMKVSRKETPIPRQSSVALSMPHPHVRAEGEGRTPPGSIQVKNSPLNGPSPCDCSIRLS